MEPIHITLKQVVDGFFSFYGKLILPRRWSQYVFQEDALKKLLFMALAKTTTVPNQDPTEVFKQKIIKMVVLGDHLTFVNKADELAINPPLIDRVVIWYKTPELEYGKLMKRFAGLSNLENVKAFTLSTKNKVACIIPKSADDEYDTIDDAYSKAGLAQNN